MHFYVVKLKTIKLIALSILVFTIFCINFSGEVAVAKTFLNVREIPIYCVDRSDGYVALTFDAAWGSDKTENILKTLKQFDVSATFFLVGMWVDKNAELVKKIDEQGCEIGTHSNTHPDLTNLTKQKMKDELTLSVNKISTITGKKVNVFRAPFGAYNNNLICEAKNLGLKTIQWDVDSLDWKGLSASTICGNIFKKVKSGSIILCHNNADNIVEALPNIILGLKQRGFKFKTVSDLVFDDNFKIDSAGKQVQI